MDSKSMKHNVRSEGAIKRQFGDIECFSVPFPANKGRFRTKIRSGIFGERGEKGVETLACFGRKIKNYVR